MTSTAPQTEEQRYARAKATKQLANLRTFVRRTDVYGVRDRNAQQTYAKALRAVVAVEDLEGVEAASRFSVRLRDLRWEAERAGFLTAGDVLAAEREVLS